MLNVNTGLPQGSIFGPLLFLIWINDMSKCSGYLDFINFPDDTTISTKNANIHHLLNTAQQELTFIDQVLIYNELFLNASKST